jgi:hypothetical protein
LEALSFGILANEQHLAKTAQNTAQIEEFNFFEKGEN